MDTQHKGHVRRKTDPHFEQVFKELLPDEYSQYESKHKKEVQEERKSFLKSAGVKIAIFSVFVILGIIFIFGVIIPASGVIANNFGIFGLTTDNSETSMEVDQTPGVQVGEAMSQLIRGVGDFGSNIAGGFQDLQDSMGTNAWSQFK